MMDAIKKPKPNLETKPPKRPSQQTGNEDRITQVAKPNPKPYAPEMKVWVSVVASSLIIVGVWIATFSIPQSNRDESPSTSELKDILTELRNTMKTGVQVVDEQRKTLSQQTKPRQPIEPTLSNEELTELARQLTMNTQASTTTTTIPTLQLPPTTTETNLPKLP